MSKVSFELNANPRSTHGRAHARRLRYEGKVPAIIYGAGTPPQVVELDHNEIMHALGHEAFYSHILTVNVDGKSQQVVLKHLQRHPFKPRIQHVDFLRVKAKEKITMQVPVHFLGEEKAPGVDKEGGVISKLMNEIEIRCLPANLPEYIAVDVSQLHKNESIHLSQVKLPSGVELTVELDEEHDPAIVSIHEPKVSMEQLEAEEAEEAEAKAAEVEETEVTEVTEDTETEESEQEPKAESSAEEGADNKKQPKE